MAGHQLDDRSFVSRNDPTDLFRLFADFPNQCRQALVIARSLDLPGHGLEPDLVALTGMGGSAAGGDFARAMFDFHSRIPFLVNRDYHLPNWLSLSTLVFCASYSGNTEETLSCYAEARRAGSKIIALTSGGKLEELARKDGNPVVKVPGGYPPRAALGFMLIPLLAICEKLGLLTAVDFESAFDLLDHCAEDWGMETDYATNPAKQLAQAMHGKLAVIYGLGHWQGIVAGRWKGQINENAKNLAFPNVFPELNHNEILGWVGAGNQGVSQWLSVILEDGTESEKMKARMKVTAELIRGVAEIHHVRARGKALLEKMLSLTFFGDFVSLYLAALNDVDPENIDSINTLKRELSKVQS